eukprot:10719192-Prorocentrum_lima.AAC.1
MINHCIHLKCVRDLVAGTCYQALWYPRAQEANHKKGKVFQLILASVENGKKDGQADAGQG